MPADEKGQFAYAFDNHINCVMTTLALYRSGSLERHYYEASLTGLASHIVTPGGAAYWQDTKHFHIAALVDAVDQRVREGNLPDILENPHFQLDEETQSAAQQGAAADSA